MGLTIDQALQKAVEAHRAGQVQEADRLYTAILKAQPNHPDANHNLGVLAVSVGKVQEALPLLKAALEANPSAAQFWLSYIDALIRLDKLAEAKTVLDQAKSKGAQGDGFDQLDQRLQKAGQAPLEANQIAAKTQPSHPNILDSLKLDQAIKLAKKKAKKGSLEEAKRIYQDVLLKFPDNKRAKDGLRSIARDSYGNASKIQDPPQDQVQSLIKLYNQGQLQQALKQVDLLVQQFPQSALLFSINGAVLKALGQLDLSVEAYTKALAIKPDYADAYNNMGNALKEQGKLEEAIAAYKKALAIKPDYADAYFNMGIALQEQGQLEEAIAAYTQALAIKPDDAEAHNNMGIALKEQGKLEEAIAAYKKALAIKPDYAEAYNNMGIVFQEQGKLEEAIAAYKKALAIKPDYAEAHNNMGIVFQEQGKLEEAIAAYKKALAIKSDYAEAYNNMGTALKEQGKLEEAIAAYKKALAIKPDYAEAHRHLSTTTKYKSDNAQIGDVQALLQQLDLNDSDRCHLLYTQAKMQEDLGDLSAAFASYVAGGELRQKLLGYEFTLEKGKFNLIKQTAPQLQDVALNITGETIRQTPIFILGMPRSGTTLAEQIVSSHSEVTGAGELPFISQFGKELIKGLTEPTLESVSVFRERYLTELAKRADGRAFVTDKMPHNFQFISLICAAFPEAKIIHMQRSAEATCWSNFKHYFTVKDLGYSYKIADTVRYYGLYKDLMNFWLQRYSDRIYNLDYDKLTEDQETETRRLIEYLELSWEAACLSPHENKRSVVTASNLQVRQKVYTGSSQAWKKYEPFLDGAFDGLDA